MRTATRKRKPHGPPPLPRRRVNPALYDAVRACGRPGWLIAVEAGLTHGTVLSQLLTAEEIPASSINITRLKRVAEVVGFDPGSVFL